MWCAAIGNRIFDPFLGAFAKLRKATISFFMSVYFYPSVPLSFRMKHATRQKFVRFDIWVYSFKSVEKIQVSLNMTRITGTLRADLCTFVLTSQLFVE